MSYFNPKLESHVYVDASSVGISAILMQKEGHSLQCVHYASRALTDTEQRYSQIEREALAVVWGCEYLNMYLYGALFRYLLIINHCSHYLVQLNRNFLLVFSLGH